MDSLLQPKRISPGRRNGVTYGEGVILYGSVHIGRGSIIGDYSVIGRPNIDQIKDSDRLKVTQLGTSVILGPYVVIHAGATLGNRCRIEARGMVGPSSILGSDSRLLYGSQIHWRVSVGPRSLVAGFVCDRAVIEDNVIMFGEMLHRLQGNNFDRAIEPSPTIRSRARVGFGAKIIGGVTVGCGAFIGANVIITKDVKAGRFVTLRRTQVMSISKLRLP